MAKGLWFNNMKQLFLENKSYTLSHFTALKNLLKECCFLLKKILTCRQSPKNNKHTHTHTHIHSHVPTFPNSGTPAESYIPERSTSLNLVILCKEPWEICSTGTGGKPSEELWWSEWWPSQWEGDLTLHSLMKWRMYFPVYQNILLGYFSHQPTSVHFIWLAQNS